MRYDKVRGIKKKLTEINYDYNRTYNNYRP